MHVKIKRHCVKREIVPDISSDEPVPKENTWFVHRIKQFAGIMQVADVREIFKKASEEAVLLGEARGEEKCVYLFELAGDKIGVQESGEG